MHFALTAWLLVGALFAPQAEAGPTAQVRSRPDGEGLTRIELGFYLLDLSAVDGASQSFEADIFVSARWRDPRLASAENRTMIVSVDEIWNPRLELVNIRSVQRTLSEEVRVSPDGTVTYGQRFIGSFSAEMNLREFPLDRQRFYIQIVSAGGDGGKIEFVPISDGNLSGQRERLSISDWRIGPFRIEQAPLVLNAGGGELAGIALVVDAERELGYYVVQVILPLMMIVSMAWTVFWVDPSVVPTRLGVVVTTMLTLIAYRFALSSLVPRLPYLTRLDWFMLGSTSLILATLMTMAATAHLKARGRDELVAKIDRWGRVCFVAVAAVVWTVPWLY